MFEKRAMVEMPADAVSAAGGGALGYAGFWARLAALIVDNTILVIFALVLLVGASFVSEEAAEIALVACVLVFLLYWPVMECSERQATFGKQLLGIQVTDMDGVRLSFLRSLLRNLAKIISGIPLNLGFLFAAFTSRKQALHDMITSCLVVRAGPSHLWKAVLATVVGFVLTVVAVYYYVSNVYFPQRKARVMAGMEQAMKEAQKGVPATPPVAKAPVTAQPPVAKAPESAPTPAAKPAPEKTTPFEVRSMTPQELAEFEKKMEELKRESAKVTVVTPTASPPAAKEVAPPVPKMEMAAKPAPEAATAAEKPKPARRVALRKPAPPAAVAEAPPAPPVRTPKYNDVMTAVMYRDHAGAAELLDLGWWADRPDSNGLTPLMAAAMNGDAAMVQLLLKRGANPNHSVAGGSVLDFARRGGDGKVVELLQRAGAR